MSRKRCERRSQPRHHQSPDGSHSEGHTAALFVHSRAESLLANGGARCAPFPPLRVGGRDHACAVVNRAPE